MWQIDKSSLLVLERERIRCLEKSEIVIHTAMTTWNTCVAWSFHHFKMNRVIDWTISTKTKPYFIDRWHCYQWWHSQYCHNSSKINAKTSVNCELDRKQQRQAQWHRTKKNCALSFCCLCASARCELRKRNIIQNTCTWMNENNNRNISQCAIITKLCCTSHFLCLFDLDRIEFHADTMLMQFNMRKFISNWNGWAWAYQRVTNVQNELRQKMHVFPLNKFRISPNMAWHIFCFRQFVSRT